MIAVLNLKMAQDKNPLLIRDHSKKFKMDDIILLRNHTPKDMFDSKYKPSFRICKKITDKAFDFQDNLGKIKSIISTFTPVASHRACVDQPPRYKPIWVSH